MYIEERHRAILEWLSQHGSISNTDIQKNFDVSYDSAKRDLRILEEKGLLKRTHGGALPIRQIAAGRPETMTFKDIPQIKPNYLQIAKEAVSLIQENDVIYIPSTTLGLFMVKNLPAHLKIKVVTNSILIADELRTLTDVSVIILGGEMDNKGNCCPLTSHRFPSRLQRNISLICLLFIVIIGKNLIQRNGCHAGNHICFQLFVGIIQH